MRDRKTTSQIAGKYKPRQVINGKRTWTRLDRTTPMAEGKYDTHKDMVWTDGQ